MIALRHRIRVAFAVPMLGAALLAPGALAEKGDKDKAIDFSAEQPLEVDIEKRAGTARGNVIITQGTLTIKADRIDFKQNPHNSLSAVAYGNPISFRQKKDDSDEYFEGFAQRAVYDVVLESQRAALALVKPGVRYREVHRAAARAMVNGLVELGIYKGDPAELFELGAAALFFPHGVGHLLGLDVHDMEDLGDRAGYAPGRERSQAPGDRYLRLDRDLLPGMALTIEPGFYQIAHLLERPEEVGELEPFLQRDVLARFRDVRGIRIEDDVLVTDSGFEVLTEAIPKSAEAIEAARAG